jgi:hypothetical protein
MDTESFDAKRQMSDDNLQTAHQKIRAKRNEGEQAKTVRDAI